MDALMPKAESSRLNAQMHSTGPQTVAGKLASSRNALTHGLTAKKPVLTAEDRGAYLTLRAAWWVELAPVGLEEIDLAEEIVWLIWKRDRGEVLEANLWEGPVGKERKDREERRDREEKPAGEDGGGGQTEKEKGEGEGEGEVKKSDWTMAEALAAQTREFGLMMRYVQMNRRALEKARKEYKMAQHVRTTNESMVKDAELGRRVEQARADEAVAKTQQQAAEILALKKAAGLIVEEAPAAESTAGAKAGAVVERSEEDWRAVYLELYLAVSAGPQAPHPLPETYYGAFAIWLKQTMMVELDIADDEAGSRIAALETTLQMRLENAPATPGTVWGAAKALAHWREACARSGAGAALFEAWRALIQRDWARREGTVEEAAAQIAALPEGADLSEVIGPWLSSGNLALKDAAMALAEKIREARGK